jgi:hypothetical protein
LTKTGVGRKILKAHTQFKGAPGERSETFLLLSPLRLSTGDRRAVTAGMGSERPSLPGIA